MVPIYTFSWVVLIPSGKPPVLPGLHLAVNGGNGKVVTALLEAGADPEARGPRGRTPLHSALSSLSLVDVLGWLETEKDLAP